MLSVLAFPIVAVAAAMPQNMGDGRGTLLKSISVYDQAIKKEDIASVKKKMHPEYQGYFKGGAAVGRDQTLADLERFFGRAKGVGVERRVQATELRGTTATVRSTSALKATVPGPDGRPAKMRIEANFVQTWVFTKQTWLLRSSVGSNRRMFINGKKVVG